MITGKRPANPDKAFFWCYWICLILILFGGVIGKVAIGDVETGRRGVLSGFPANLGDWQKVSDGILEVPVVETLRVDEYIVRDYRRGSNSVSLYIGYYRDHKKFAEIHTPENCQANSGWELLEKTGRILRNKGAGRNRDIRFAQELFGRDGSRYVFLYFYKVMDHTTTSFFRYKLKVIENSLFKHRSDVAFVRVIIPVRNGDPSEAVSVGEQFLEDLAPVIFEILS